MDSCRGSDVNMVGSSVPGDQGNMAAMSVPSGKMPTGRAVKCEAITVQTPRQLTVTSNTARRATTGSVVAVTSASLPARETVRAGTPGAFEIQECDYKPMIKGLREAIQNSLSKLKEIWPKKSDEPVLLYMAVTGEMDQLQNRYKIYDVESDDYKYMAFQLGPYHADTLHPTLEIIQHQTKNGRGWEYHGILGSIGKYLNLLASETSDVNDDMQLLKDIYWTLVYNELAYLKFMKDFPLESTVKCSDTIIGQLLSSKHGVQGYQWMSDEEVARVLSRKDHAERLVQSRLAEGGANKDIGKLEEDMCRETDDKKRRMMERRHHDILKETFMERKAEYCKLEHVSTEEYISYITELSHLLFKCTSQTSGLHLLPHAIEKEMIHATKMQLNNHLHRGVRLEEKMLNFMEELLDKKVIVDEKCGELCLYCRELNFPPSDAMRANIKTEKAAGCQFGNKLAKLDCTHKNRFEARNAADKLRFLLHEHGHEIRMLDIKNPDVHRLINIRNSLHKILFHPLIEQFYKLRKKECLEKERFSDARSQFHSELVTLIPYTFVLVNEKERASLADVACAAWYCDIEELSQAVSFREKDVDCLLELKHVSPCIPGQPLQLVLEKALQNVFQFVLHDTGGNIPVEKIAILSQWVDGLNRIKHVDEQLMALNEQWKKINGCTVKKGGRVSPGIPLTSVPVFDIDQRVSKSVALEGKPETAGVPSDQSMANAALNQPASKDLPAPATRLSSTSAEQASVAKRASKKSVISPESQTGAGKDKSSGATEQLTPAVTGVVTATTPTLQTVSSPLQGADRFPFKTRADRYKPRSTITAPVKTRASSKTEDHKMNVKTTGPGVQEIPKGKVAPVKTQTDRKGHEAAAVQTRRQRTEVQDGTLRTSDGGGDDYAVAIKNAPDTPWKMATSAEFDALKIMECKYQPTNEFRTDVERSLKTLNMKRKSPGTDAWSFCLVVAIEIRRLKRKYNLETSETNYEFMKFQLGPHYVNSLRPALEIIMDKANNECGWEYYQDVKVITQHLRSPLYCLSETPEKDQTRELAQNIYSRLLESELNYLEFMKRFPFKNTAGHSMNIIRYLLSGPSGARKSLFITRQQADNILERASRLKKTIESRLAEEDIDRKTDQLKKEVYRGDADVLVRRRYSDLLRETYLELKPKCREGSTQEQLSVLKKLFELHVMHTSVVSDLYSLSSAIEITITNAITEKLTSSLASSVRPEKEMLDFVDLVRSHKVGSRRCGILCLRCKELEFLPRTEAEITTRTDRITVDQCEKQIAEIRSRLDTATGLDDLTDTADTLKQLLHQHRHEIEALDIEGSYMESINKIRKDLGMKLFGSAIEKFNKLQGEEGVDETGLFAAMSEQRPELAKLIPYVFTLDGDASRVNLMNVVGAAWYCDIESLSRQESFRKEDVDRLLELKHIVPYTLNLRIQVAVEKALIQIFQFVDRNGIGEEIPVEKVAALSQWVDDLDRVININEELKSCNEKWKEASEGAVSKRDMVSSDMSLSSVLLFKEVHKAFSQHSVEEYLAAARLLGPVDIEQSPQKEDFEIIKDLIGKELFGEVLDTHARLVKEHPRDDSMISRELYNFKNVFLRNKDILFVLENDEQRENWRKCACIAWKETMQALIKKGEYSDEDLREMVCVSEVAADLPDPEVRVIVQKVIQDMLTYWNSQEGKDKLSQALMNKIRDWIDRVDPDQKVL